MKHMLASFERDALIDGGFAQRWPERASREAEVTASIDPRV